MLKNDLYWGKFAEVICKHSRQTTKERPSCPFAQFALVYVGTENMIVYLSFKIHGFTVKYCCIVSVAFSYLVYVVHVLLSGLCGRSVVSRATESTL